MTPGRKKGLIALIIALLIAIFSASYVHYRKEDED